MLCLYKISWDLSARTYVYCSVRTYVIVFLHLCVSHFYSYVCILYILTPMCVVCVCSLMDSELGVADVVCIDSPLIEAALSHTHSCWHLYSFHRQYMYTVCAVYCLMDRLCCCMQELRWPLRLLLLQVFGSVFTLDPTAISVCLSTVLPNVLGKDIQENKNGKYPCTLWSNAFLSLCYLQTLLVLHRGSFIRNCSIHNDCHCRYVLH